MKKILTLITTLLLCVTVLFAQAPEKFSYQAVVRNASNALVANTSVGVRVSVLQGHANGNAMYVETHTAVTNANGLLTIEIGGGNVQQGSFAGINWADGPYFLKTETDPDGGSNYTVTTTQQLMSVPYALYAKDAGNAFSGDYNDLTNTPTIPTVPTNVSAFTNDAGYLTNFTETDPQYNAWDKDYNDLINKPTIPTVPTNVSAFTNDAGYLTNFTETDPQYNAWDKDYNDLINKPTIPTVPTNVSAFTNDAGYITSADIPEAPTVPTNVSAFTNDAGYLTDFTETDPQYNAWDKDYNDLINKPTIPTVPTNVSAFTNDAGYITLDAVPGQVNADWEATEGVALILNKPQIPEVPENVSTFNNDAGYLTSADLMAVINALNARIDSLQNQIDNAGHGGDSSSYHDDYDFAQLPTVVTVDTVYNLMQTLAQVAIVLVDDGGGALIKMGVCYDTTATPTIANHQVSTTSSSSYGYYGSQSTYGLYNLTPGTTYYARAFATNNKGTAYGEVVSFTTPIAEQTYGEPCPEAATVTDIDGNEYNTVQIGEQCWMRENLRTTHTPSGQDLRLQQDRYITYGDNSRVQSLGYLYTYSAAMDGAAASNTVPSEVQGICPDGWHLPSNAEWQALMDYVSSQPDWECGDGYFGKALAAATEWTTSNEYCALGNDVLSNNKSGFSALTTSFMSCSGGYAYLNSNGLYTYNSGEGTRAVRCLRDFIAPPTVVLNSVTKQGANALKIEAEVTYPGVGEMTARGICWGYQPNPTVDGEHTTEGGEAGPFGAMLTDLTYGNTYYIRAYATNAAGTSYSQQLSYYLHERDNEPCPSVATVTDVDGNTYNTVQIGNQCWMKENMRTTHYADGGSTGGYYPGSNSSNVTTYGYLYTWSSATNAYSNNTNEFGMQGVCPTGWHVPSDAEWTELIEYVSHESMYACSGNSENIAKALASTLGWATFTGDCAVGDTPDSNNTTGFSAMPAGYNTGNWNNGSFAFGEYAALWSSTRLDDSYARYIMLSYDDATVGQNNISTSMALSVRCLRDGGGTSQAVLPSVVTKSVLDLTTTSAVISGRVTDSENTLVSKGFEWKAADADNYTVVPVEGEANEVFTYALEGLSPQTSYTFRAYATTTSDTTVYGNELTFTTPAACPNVSIVNDIDNNEYHTVLIGSQCWMAENLRSTHYSDGTAIDGYEYPDYYDGTPDILLAYGYNYSQNAMMRGAFASNTNPSGVQGVCPAGWHVPSKAEWTQLTDYLNTQSQYLCHGYQDYYAKALASGTDDWRSESYYDDCSIAKDLTKNNATGFSARPSKNDNEAMIWTTTNNGDRYYYFSLRSDRSTAEYYTGYDEYPVRCLRDGGGNGASVVPAVTTMSASYVAMDSTVLRCLVANADNQNITVGFEYRVAGTETYESASVQGSYNGVVSVTVSGLSALATYEYRAFVTAGDTTVYGAVMTFTTTFGSCPDGSTVTDVDGNTYNTIQIGNQCWMKENLRVKHYADGTPISLGNDTSTVIPYFYYPNGSESTDAVYGLHYNWKAVMHNSLSNNSNPSTVQGVCPDGWHMPSQNEWGVLRNFLSAAEFVCDGVDEDAVGKSIASKTGWSTSDTLCDVGYLPENNDITGFSAYPAGSTWFGINSYGNHYSRPLNFGTMAMFWSCTAGEDATAASRLLYHDTPYFYSNANYYRQNGMSVRCLRGDAAEVILLPTVTTDTVSDITGISAVCGGEVTADGGAEVTARGLCWSVSQNPTVSNSHTTNGNGIGAFSADLTGLMPSTTYYVRAYATNIEGTAYGEQQSFTTESIPDSGLCYLFVENFDNGILPANWTTLNIDNDGYTWQHNTEVNTSIQGHNGSSGMMTSASYVNNVGALTPNNWLITPAVTIPDNALLSFWVSAQDASWAGEHYGVYVTTSTNYTDPANYTLLFEETIDAEGGAKVQGAWKQKTASLQAYAGQTVHIAFRHFNCTDMYYINLDDVVIQHDCADGE
jgi:uncharacterized protein (TIGR02145 family)